jgi:acetoacetyl-CoA reductase
MNARLAVVTGGLGGIGSETCRRLAASGRRVLAVDRADDDPLRDALRRELAACGIAFEPADVSDGAACVELLTRVRERHGEIDILVNAAGITRDARLVRMSVEDWDAVLRVNLDSVFHLCRHVVPGMCERGFGRIVNISSVNAHTGQFGQTNYAAAKAGLHGFTMSLARETARYGVTVNSVAPGYIDTGMTRAMRADIRTRVVDSIPVGRIGLPADVARAVDFLAADEAGYITGAALPVNGGLLMSF